jgi:hypothetical protein
MVRLPFVAGLFLLIGVTPLVAHHSFAAEFDSKQPVQVKGVVTKIDWMNPHTWVYVDVKDEAGAVQKWQFETGAPNELVRRGWKMDDLKVGDQVSIDGFRAKKPISNTGLYTGNARSITLPSGLKVFAGSAIQVEPQ